MKLLKIIDLVGQVLVAKATNVWLFTRKILHV